MPANSKLISRVYLPLAMLVLASALYANTKDNPFLADDVPGIVNNPDVTQPEGLRWLWTRAEPFGPSAPTSVYRPITALTMHLSAAADSYVPDPRHFRYVNIALLALVGVLAARWFAGYVHLTPAWLAAFVLVAHPINSELIHQVVGRSDLLEMIGVLGFLDQQHHALREGRWSLPRAAAGLLFAVIALGAKETGVVLLPLAGAQGWLFPAATVEQLRLPPAITRRSVAAWSIVLLGAPLALYLAGSRLATPFDHDPRTSDMAANPLVGADFLTRLASALSLAAYDAWQLAWPDTSIVRSPVTLPHWTSGSVWVGAVVVLACTVMLTRMLRRRNWLSLALLLALGQYLLVSNLLVPWGVYASNRLMLPFTVCGAAFLAAGLNAISIGSVRRQAAVAIPVALLLLGMGVHVIFNINPMWLGARRRAWADWDHHQGNPVAMFNVARAIYETRAAPVDYDDTIYWLNRVIEKRPDSCEARKLLATVYYLHGDTAAAVEQYRRLLTRLREQHQPLDLDALKALADLQITLHHVEAARSCLRAAADLAPGDPDVLFYWGALAELEEKHDDAAAYYRQVIARHPDHERARYRLKMLEVRDRKSIDDVKAE